MPKLLVTRSLADVQAILKIGDPKDSRKAGWAAIRAGSEVIAEIQTHAMTRRWISMKDARPFLDRYAKKILQMRLDAIHGFKVAPHHRRGFRPSARTGARDPRPVNALCLVSGTKGQEIPGLVDFKRVVVDAEHMQQALGPATIAEIFKIRKRIGENVYISTNVSETPQTVRSVETGEIDIRSTSALTASKVIAALNAGADVVKVGFANTDGYKRDLKEGSVLEQMRLVRDMVDAAVKEGILVYSLARNQGRYPLVSVFFPEMGINTCGDRPMDIASAGLRLTRQAGWQGMLIDTFEKFAHRRYADFYSLEDTATLAREAHAAGLELWIAGSIRDANEVAAYLKAGVDLICFGGAVRSEKGDRFATVKGRRDDSIKRPLVEKFVRVFDRVDPKPKDKPRSTAARRGGQR